jgi:hypothetical protein
MVPLSASLFFGNKTAHEADKTPVVKEHIQIFLQPQERTVEPP